MNPSQDLQPKSGLPLSGAIRNFFSAGSSTRRLFLDRVGTGVVTLGGWVIIFSILAILFVIVAEIYPLFKAPRADIKTSFHLETSGLPLAVGVDEYREVSYVIDSGGIHFHSLVNKQPIPTRPLSNLQGAAVVAVSSSGRGLHMLGLSDGRVIPLRVKFQANFKDDIRTIEPGYIEEDPLVMREDGQPVDLLTHVAIGSGYRLAVVTAPGKGRVSLATLATKKNFMGTVTKKLSTDVLDYPVKGRISAMTFDSEGEYLLAGTTSGQVLRAFLEDEDTFEVETIGSTLSADVGVSLLGYVLGGYTLIVGDTRGGVTSCQLIKGADGKQRLQKIYQFSAHRQPPVLFGYSLRDKGFLTGSEKELKYHYATNGETQLSLTSTEAGPFSAAVMAPKQDGILAVDRSGVLIGWEVDNPHPQINLASLFAETWYEGYKEPGYVWQSTGGSDEFESKFSLTPLIFGTLKGTLYALLFAVPLSLLGALYTSQFMQPNLRETVKPVIELMAALPSVVLGFFAALLIAPQVEKILPGIILTPFVIVILVVAALVVYEVTGADRGFFRPGREIAVLIPITLAGGLLAFSLGGVFEIAFLGGDYRIWLQEVFHVTYDQRNALVVGLAMGFAVIPIIFTITEDSLANVPSHLTASSLALGATPWQTALNVVLPTASPGIFSAVMIGFGRAVGETMIVLMATGNTPVMEWSIFNGFRALSANIAVELPEAPEGGTLFRILFMAAFLLFVMTFFINTLAEYVRLRLRARYRVL